MTGTAVDWRDTKLSVKEPYVAWLDICGFANALRERETEPILANPDDTIPGQHALNLYEPLYIIITQYIREEELGCSEAFLESMPLWELL